MGEYQKLIDKFNEDKYVFMWELDKVLDYLDNPESSARIIFFENPLETDEACPEGYVGVGSLSFTFINIEFTIIIKDDEEEDG